MNDVFNALILIIYSVPVVVSKNADFHFNRSISVISFGSCNQQNKEQPLWKKIIDDNPDVWIWLGDAVYADTQIIMALWIPSPLKVMKEKFELQKQNEGYKALIDSGIPILGVWDDHDYGLNDGGKNFRYRLQSQNIFLDFLDEPINSIRRKREGIYASYSYGTGDRIVKIILLDVRSHHVRGKSCDMLGEDQWRWLSQQLDDDKPQLILIGSGIQVLSDILFIDKWRACPSSLDRLIWMSQKRSRVMFLSGDIHFSEVNCLNTSGTGYPIYEVTSSGMTHTCVFRVPKSVCKWYLKNVVASQHRVSNVVTEKSYSVLQINWDSSPVTVSVRMMGQTGIHSSYTISLDDISIRRHSNSCPVAIEQPSLFWKRVFWCGAIFLGVAVALIFIRIITIIGRWIAVKLLKDFDMNIKRRIEKLRQALFSVYNLKDSADDQKLHTE